MVAGVGHALDAQARALQRIAEVPRLFARIAARLGEHDQPVGRIARVHMVDGRELALPPRVVAEGVAVELAGERAAQGVFIGQ